MVGRQRNGNLASTKATAMARGRGVGLEMPSFPFSLVLGFPGQELMVCTVLGLGSFPYHSTG